MRRAHISVRVVIRRGQRRDVNDFTQRLCGGGGGGGRVAELELEELVEVEGMGVGMGVGVGVRVRKKELLWRSFDWFFIFFFYLSDTSVVRQCNFCRSCLCRLAVLYDTVISIILIFDAINFLRFLFYLLPFIFF